MADLSKLILPNNSEYDLKDATARSELANKQATLVSGTNIKTINNESILGSGNLTVSAEPEIFWATYGTTTNSEITTANSAGKICAVVATINQDEPMPLSVVCILISNAYDVAEFQCVHSSTIVEVTCAMDEWSVFVKPVSLTTHVHGNITSSGDITATAPTIASGDQLVINDNSASKITNGPAFGTSTTTFLRNDGTWAEPSSGDSLPSQTGNSGKFLTTDGTDASWATVTQDDHKWNDVALNKTSKGGYGGFIPYVDETSSTTAGLKMATTSPTSESVALWDSSKYLYSTTPSSSDNSTKVATTAYVTTAVSGISVPQASTTTPSMDGTASYGAGTTWARSDHVHPTDTSRASSTHTHGNITNGGDITATAPTIASGDQLIINDNSESKITNGPTFDGSTTNKYLSPKGTWETVPSAPSIASTSSILKGDNSGNAIAATGGTDYLAPPSSPSAGDVLTYDSTNGWIASPPSGGGSLPDQTGHSGDILTTNGTTASWMDVSEATSVSIDTTVTANSSNLITSGAVATAISNVDALPSQSGNSGKFLTTNGSAASWASTPTEIPSQSGNSGKYLTTNGSAVSWANAPTELPSQSGNANKYLKTNGSSVSWANVDALPSQSGHSGDYLTTDGSSASWADAVTTSTISIDSTPTASSNNLIKSGGVYAAINTKVNRTSAVNEANTQYTTLMARGEKMIEKTSYDTVSDWSTELVNGAIAWCYE